MSVPDGLQAHRISIYDGSIRSGKTINSLFAWLDYLNKERTLLHGPNPQDNT